MQQKNSGDADMEAFKERRKEKRLYCDWPIWFAEDFGKKLCCGRMLAISSTAVSFTGILGKDCPQNGQKTIIYFRIPRVGEDDSSDLVLLTRPGRIHRIDETADELSHIVVQFDQKLPFKPAKLKLVNKMLSV